MFAQLAYQFAIGIYHFGISCASLFNAKAKLFIAGRRQQQQILRTRKPTMLTIWLHCASQGELEQGLPIAQQLKTQRPDCTIVLTLFSPSAMQHFKQQSCIDEVYYLPMDTARNAKRFIDSITPDLAIFVKYEFWYFYLRGLSKRSIPTFLVCGMLRPHPFTKWYGKLHRKMLGFFTHLYVQPGISVQTCQTLLLNHYTVSGDTRADRVLSIAQEDWHDEVIAQFVAQHTKTIIAGSTWQQDEQLLAQWHRKYTDQNTGLIIVPHELDEMHLKELEKLFDKSCRYSDCKPNTSVLILDKMGLLSRVYRYADIAYVGGGFGVGIHNVLEPAAFRIPICCGPKISKSEEAKTLSELGALRVVLNEGDLHSAFIQLGQEAEQIAEILTSYFAKSSGATSQITRAILPYLKVDDAVSS